MTSRIVKDFTFLAAIHFEGKFMVNLYELSAKMSINSEDSREQNVAVERTTHFLSNVLETCIFVSEKEKDAIDKYTKAGMQVCVIPEEPYDQIIGLILINKCNAIMEDRVIMTDIIFGSKLSNLIKFELSDEMASEEFPGKFWYNDPSLCLENKKGKKDKIVKLFEQKDDWADLELTWEA